MKIENKIIISNVFNVGLMVLIGIFAFQAMNSMLTKLRFMEIADDLNASFLEMRLSEKNFFLYKNRSALTEIQEKIKEAEYTVQHERNNITRAVGPTNLERLQLNMRNYFLAVEDAKTCTDKAACESRLRAAGRSLREFSESITRLERTRVNGIIGTTQNVMLYSFIGIILSAIIVSHLVSQGILLSLRKIEGLARSIAAGNFGKIDGTVSDDELGAVISAVNSMSEELKNREEEILQSKKLASMGILTAGVAHEITNPVNNISMIAQTYAEVYSSLSEEDKVQFMKKVEQEADRIKEIVRHLLEFSKPKKGDQHPADVNALVKKTLVLVQNMLDINKIELRLHLKKGRLLANIDENQIQQVLVNLIVNAAQAMPEGGWINLTTNKDPEKGLVKVCVSDSGKGIPAEHLPHIFDPFFSTKGVGGTGLGLSVSYGIIKDHKGNIRVESTEGIGSTFTVELPASVTEA